MPLKPSAIPLDLLSADTASSTSPEPGAVAGPPVPGTPENGRRGWKSVLTQWLWSVSQWAAVFWYLKREVHWIHAACVVGVMAWVRMIAFPCAAWLRGAELAKPCMRGELTVLRVIGRLWSVEAFQGMSERLWIALLGVVPVAVLHWGFHKNGSLEMAELACFGYVFVAMVLSLPCDSQFFRGGGDYGGVSISLLGVSAFVGCRFHLDAPVLRVVFLYSSILSIPTGALLALRLMLEAGVAQRRVLKAAGLLALYLWATTALWTMFGLACEQRESLYRAVLEIPR